jgi:hypothetical protein
MSSEIRTFKIRDAVVHEDELALGEFLRTATSAGSKPPMLTAHGTSS